MPGVLRSLTSRGLRAGAVGLALAAGQPLGRVAADGPELPTDPIAESNRMTDPFHRPPVIQLMAADAPWLTPGTPAPLPAGPPAPQRLEPLPPASLPPQPPPVSMSVNWSAPGRRPVIAAPLPTSDRPMIPCEAVVAPPPPPPVVLAPPRMEPPPATPATEVLPPPRPVVAEPATPPAPAKPTLTAAPDDDFRPARTVTTCRFLDEAAPPPKPVADDDVILAIVRRGGPATGTVAEVRKAVEAACRKAVKCQTEVAGERQVRVLLTVRSLADWQRLYAHLQELPDLGEYGLLFQVRVEKEAPER